MTTFLNNNFQGIQHIGIPVADISRSKDFYTRLGFESIMERTFPEKGGSTTAIMMRRENAIMELYQFTPPASYPASSRIQDKSVSRPDGAVDHIAFSVIDIESAYNECLAAGLNIIETAPADLDFWEKGCTYFTIRGPDCEKLEFNQIR